MLAAHLPLLVCGFKRLLKAWTDESAPDHERLSLMAVCTFMKLLNISRLPMFGLVTSGPTEYCRLLGTRSQQRTPKSAVGGGLHTM